MQFHGILAAPSPPFRNDTKVSVGGRVVRRCWVNFQCRGVLLIWIIVGQGPIALAVGAGWGCLDIFSLIYHFSFLSSSLWETVRYRLKYCLKGPLSPKQPTNNQPTKVSRGQSPTHTDITFYILVALVDTMRLYSIQSPDPVALTSFSSIIRPLSIMVYAAKGDMAIKVMVL